eukprot:tig00021462_g21589.t1
MRLVQEPGAPAQPSVLPYLVGTPANELWRSCPAFDAATLGASAEPTSNLCGVGYNVFNVPATKPLYRYPDLYLCPTATWSDACFRVFRNASVSPSNVQQTSFTGNSPFSVYPNGTLSSERLCPSLGVRGCTWYWAGQTGNWGAHGEELAPYNFTWNAQPLLPVTFLPPLPPPVHTIRADVIFLLDATRNVTNAELYDQVEWATRSAASFQISFSELRYGVRTFQGTGSGSSTLITLPKSAQVTRSLPTSIVAARVPLFSPERQGTTGAGSSVAQALNLTHSEFALAASSRSSNPYSKIFYVVMNSCPDDAAALVQQAAATQALGARIFAAFGPGAQSCGDFAAFRGIASAPYTLAFASYEDLVLAGRATSTAQLASGGGAAGGGAGAAGGGAAGGGVGGVAGSLMAAVSHVQFTALTSYLAVQLPVAYGKMTEGLSWTLLQFRNSAGVPDTAVVINPARYSPTAVGLLTNLAWTTIVFSVVLVLHAIPTVVFLFALKRPLPAILSWPKIEVAAANAVFAGVVISAAAGLQSTAPQYNVACVALAFFELLAAAFYVAFLFYSLRRKVAGKFRDSAVVAFVPAVPLTQSYSPFWSDALSTSPGRRLLKHLIIYSDIDSKRRTAPAPVSPEVVVAPAPEPPGKFAADENSKAGPAPAGGRIASLDAPAPAEPQLSLKSMGDELITSAPREAGQTDGKPGAEGGEAAAAEPAPGEPAPNSKPPGKLEVLVDRFSDFNDRGQWEVREAEQGPRFLAKYGLAFQSYVQGRAGYLYLPLDLTKKFLMALVLGLFSTGDPYSYLSQALDLAFVVWARPFVAKTDNLLQALTLAQEILVLLIATAFVGAAASGPPSNSSAIASAMIAFQLLALLVWMVSAVLNVFKMLGLLVKAQRLLRARKASKAAAAAAAGEADPRAADPEKSPNPTSKEPEGAVLKPGAGPGKDVERVLSHNEHVDSAVNHVADAAAGLV